MNYCTRCQSYYQQPGTCNCFAPSRTSYGFYFQTPCPGCGEIPCDHSGTGCPMPPTVTVTVTDKFDVGCPTFNYRPADWDETGQVWIASGEGL